MGSCLSLNYTSYGRDDNEPVPSVEKLRNLEKDPKIGSLEELKTFGEDTLETGDILICHCTHAFGKLAQVGTFSVWDHVSLVVRLPPAENMEGRIQLVQNKPIPTIFSGNDVPEGAPPMQWTPPSTDRAGKVEVFEAMGCGVYSYDWVDWAIARGNCNKYVAVRRLNNTKTGQRGLSDDQKAKLEAFVREFWAREYEDSGLKGMSELVAPIVSRAPSKSMHKARDKSKEALDRLFCSELVAEAYQHIGLLPERTLNSNEILPSMFGPGKTLDKYMADQSHGFKLSEPEIYKAPKSPLTTAIMQRRTELWNDKNNATTNQAEQPEVGQPLKM